MTRPHNDGHLSCFVWSLQSFVSSTYDKQGRSHQMFKLLSQYPDIVLDKAVDSLKADGVVVYNKVSDAHLTNLAIQIW